MSEMTEKTSHLLLHLLHLGAPASIATGCAAPPMEHLQRPCERILRKLCQNRLKTRKLQEYTIDNFLLPSGYLT